MKKIIYFLIFLFLFFPFSCWAITVPLPTGQYPCKPTPPAGYTISYSVSGNNISATCNGVSLGVVATVSGGGFTYSTPGDGRVLILQFNSGTSIDIIHQNTMLDVLFTGWVETERYISYKIIGGNIYFISTFFDWHRTNASALYPSTDGIKIRYYKKTDGNYNSTSDIVYITVAPKLEWTFPTLPNPVSPYKAMLSKRIRWRPSNLTISGTLKILNRLINIGASKHLLIFYDRQPFWRPYFDYLSFFPVECVGHEGFKTLGKFCEENDIMFGVYVLYAQMYTCEPDFDWNDVAVDSNGNYIKSFTSWGGMQSYALRNSAMSKYVDKDIPYMKQEWRLNTIYTDVLAAWGSAGMDLDCKYDSPIAAKSYNNLIYIWEHFAQLRNILNGPVDSENTQFAMQMAGYVDMLFAAPGQVKNVFPTMKQIPDFTLRKLHPLMTVYGSTWMYKTVWGLETPISDKEFYLTVAATIAYGHAGLMSPYGWGEDVAIQNAHWPPVYFNMVEPLQEKYLLMDADKILYNSSGNMVDVSTAILQSNPCRQIYVSYNKPDTASYLTQAELNALPDTLQIYVNLDMNNNWNVSFPGETYTYTLPPGGWVAMDNTGWGEFHALVNGKLLNHVGSLPIKSKTPLSSISLPPLDISCQAGNNKVFLSWEKPTLHKVASYKIYRRSASDTDYVYIDTTITPSYTDTNVINGKNYSYVITSMNLLANESDYSKSVSVTPSLSSTFELNIDKNKFNPLNNEKVKINFVLPSAEKVYLGIYNLEGELVKELLKGEEKSPNAYQYEWDGNNNYNKVCANGVYLVNLYTTKAHFSKKVVLIK